jgi:hypothetical protein
MAHVQASTANAAAARTQADAALGAQAAHPANSERFKPAPPPKFENKDKDLEFRKWLSVIHSEHYKGCPPAKIIFVWQALICLASLGLSTKAIRCFQGFWCCYG